MRRAENHGCVEPHAAAIADLTCQIGKERDGGTRNGGPRDTLSPAKQRDGEQVRRGRRGLRLTSFFPT